MTPTPTDPTLSFAEECRAGLRAAKDRLPSLQKAEEPRTLENFLVPYNQMLVDVEHTAAKASLVRSVHPDEAIRNAAEGCEQDAASFLSELQLDRSLFEAFGAIDREGLDADTLRLIDHSLRDYRRAGVDKDEATRQRLKAIDDELTQLGQAFSKNIVSDVRHIELDSAEKLAGLPDDYIASHPPGPDGKIKITTEYPDYVPFMNYADDGPLRRELYIASRSRAKGENEKVLREILELRAEKAALLGYTNWADYITEDKMMKSAANVGKFIERVVKISNKRAQKDYRELLVWKRKNLDPKAASVEDWEKSYIENKVKTENYEFDSQAVRPYFAFDKVQEGLLAITAQIYGIEYRAATDAEVWHEDVDAFDVLRDGKPIGRIYLDMHPREGKYQHAAQFTLQSGVLGAQLPEGVLVCNFPNPRTAKGPALMEHDDVETMFHEFGHLMHHVLGGQQRWLEQSGVATEWDFVEAPSQMFEEWAWSHDTLKLFAVHHETGETIPAELVKRMRRAHTFGIGAQTAQQMFYAAISLAFHTADPKTLPMTETVRALQGKYTQFPFVEGTSFHTSFGHLEGYSAMYYTYMFSLVIAKDLLTPFHKHGLLNPEWTHRYRDRILGPGGTKDAATLVEEFLGRPFNYKAFEAYLRG